MSVVQQQAARQLAYVVRVLDFLPQAGDHRVQVEHADGIAVVTGTAQRLQDKVQAVGVTVAADLALVQLQLVQHRFQAIVIDALAGDLVQYPQYQCFQRVGPVRLAALDAAAEHHFPHAVFEAAQWGGRLPQVGGFQRLLQGRGTVVQQHAGQQLRLEQLLQIGALSQQPAHHQVGLALGTALVVAGVGALDAQGRLQALLRGHANGFLQGLEAAQGAALEYLLVLGRGNVAEGHENGVAGVVVAAVEGHQLLVAEVGDMRRVAAAVVVVGRGGEQLLAQFVPQHRGDGTHGALHLVEDHTLEYQVAVRIVRLGKLDPVPLLGEVQRIQPREEHRVQVDIQQVIEVLAVLAGKGIGSPVGTGKGIHESVQGAAQHHEEGVAHRIALAAAQRGVFEDVGDAGGILGHGAQRHQEHVLAVVRGQVVMHRAGGLVAVLFHPDIQRLDGVLAHGGEGRVGAGGGVACRSHAVSLGR